LKPSSWSLNQISRMPEAIIDVIWVIALDLLKGVLGYMLISYLTIQSPAIFDHALLSLKETFLEAPKEGFLGDHPEANHTSWDSSGSSLLDEGFVMGDVSRTLHQVFKTC
jgi:hypothetical protein